MAANKPLNGKRNVLSSKASADRGGPKMIAELEKPQRKVQAKKSAKSAIAIDFPKDGEKLHPAHYAIRVTANGGEAVEVSIDNSEWKLCRHAAGHYWRDWTSICAGRHKILARLKLANGKYKKGNTVYCAV